MPRTASYEDTKRRLDKRIEQFNRIVPMPDGTYRGRVNKGQLELAARVLGFPGGLDQLLKERDFNEEHNLLRYARRVNGSNGKYTYILRELLGRVINAYEELYAR